MRHLTSLFTFSHLWNGYNNTFAVGTQWAEDKQMLMMFLANTVESALTSLTPHSQSGNKSYGLSYLQNRFRIWPLPPLPPLPSIWVTAVTSWVVQNTAVIVLLWKHRSEHDTSLSNPSMALGLTMSKSHKALWRMLIFILTLVLLITICILLYLVYIIYNYIIVL